MNKQRSASLENNDILAIETSNGRCHCCHRIGGGGWGKTAISQKEAQAYLRTALAAGNISEEIVLRGGGLRLIFSHSMVKLSACDIAEIADVPRTATAVLLLGK